MFLYAATSMSPDYNANNGEISISYSCCAASIQSAESLNSIAVYLRRIMAVAFEVGAHSYTVYREDESIVFIFYKLMTQAHMEKSSKYSAIAKQRDYESQSSGSR